jgi:hypothetical protein
VPGGNDGSGSKVFIAVQRIEALRIGRVLSRELSPSVLAELLLELQGWPVYWTCAARDFGAHSEVREAFAVKV